MAKVQLGQDYPHEGTGLVDNRLLGQNQADIGKISRSTGVTASDESIRQRLFRPGELALRG
jgi:hypothetical protein